MRILAALIIFFSVILEPLGADVTEYDFELIIFDEISGRYANSEQWQHELTDPGAEFSATENTATGIQAKPTAPNAALNITQIKGIGLKKYARKLASSKRYHVLVHKAWRQTGLADDAAIDMPIDSRPTDKGNANSIHGSIKIVLGRYLHIYTDMVYQQPNKDTTPILYGPDSQQYREYPIKFHRRMRSKELHYLDHPIVGILVMARPVAKQEQRKEDT